MIKTPLSTVIGGAFWTPGATIIGSSSKNLTQLIKSLFSNNEVGFAYDPNDLTTLYQDATGTIPVTAAGQPVGLVLDKSKGLVLGGELVVDGGFNDATKWTKDTGWSVSGGVGVATNVVGGNIFQVIQRTVGKTYLISGTVVTISSGSVRLLADNTDIPIVTTNAPKTFSYIVRASTPNITIGFRSTDGFTGTVDNVSVKEVTGNHAYQTTSASRPILRKNAVTGANYLEFDGSDDFLQTNSIDFTATDKVSLFAGVRKLSDVAAAVVFELSPVWVYNEGSFIMHAPHTNGGSNFYSGARGTATATISLASTIEGSKYAAPVSAVVSAKHNISGDYSMMVVNGVRGSTATADKGTGNFGNYPLYIGRRSGISAPFNGHLYGLIGIGRLTSDSETIALEKELAKRTGVTLNV